MQRENSIIFFTVPMKNVGMRGEIGIDYFTFGSPMPGRSYSSNSYKYAFNGKRSDAEAISTAGGIQDYGFRIYNPSLGKFLSVDPLTRSYPYLSPYAFAENDVIRSIDLDGLEKRIVIQTENNAGQITQIKITTFIQNQFPTDNEVRDKNGNLITKQEILVIRVNEDGTIISAKGADEFTPQQAEVNTKPDEVKTTHIDKKDKDSKEKSTFKEGDLKGKENVKDDGEKGKVLKVEKTKTFDYTPDSKDWIKKLNDKGKTIDTDKGGTKDYTPPPDKPAPPIGPPKEED